MCRIVYREQVFTCRLPRGQYSVTMQTFGGSIQAPINLVRWLNWTSLIYNQHQTSTFSYFFSVKTLIKVDPVHKLGQSQKGKINEHKYSSLQNGFHSQLLWSRQPLNPVFSKRPWVKASLFTVPKLGPVSIAFDLYNHLPGVEVHYSYFTTSSQSHLCRITHSIKFPEMKECLVERAV